MISKIDISDIESVISLGKEIDKKFDKLYDIKNLPENETIYVYKDNDEVIGFLHILKTLDFIDILNLVVREESRKEGIASLLIDYLLSNKDLPPKIMLEVRESNKAAIMLYNKFNFEVVNVRKKYYGNDNALIMERKTNL